MSRRTKKVKVRTQPAWALGGLVVGLVVGLVIVRLINQDMETGGHRLTGTGMAEVVGVTTLLCLALASAISRSRQSAAPQPTPVRTEVAAVAAPQLGVRACPHCQAPMPRDADTCPHCHATSPAWTYSQGVWWTQTSDAWYWLDESQNTWQRWQVPTGTAGLPA